MKTILFIDKSDAELWDSFRRYDYILNEYEAAGVYAVCNWHSEGKSVRTAVPDLEKLVGVDEQWRAIVVSDLRIKGIEPADDLHFDNPFDFPESYALDDKEPVRESERPFVRLTQMLGGIPEKAAASWSDWLKGSYDDAAVAKVAEAAASDTVTPPKLGDIDIVLPQTEDKYDLLDRYRLGVLRPQELLCVTPRDIDADLSDERHADFLDLERKVEEEHAALLELAYRIEHFRELGIEEAEQVRLKDELDRRTTLLAQSEQNIGFWQRNNYPACARFIVCDRHARTAEAEGEGCSTEQNASAQRIRSWEEVVPEREIAEVHEPDAWFGFWLCVLSLAMADIGPEYLRPFAVHRVSVNLDKDDFGKVLSNRYTQWVTVRELLEAELVGEEKRLEPSELRMADLPPCNTSIGVTFDLVDEGNLYADQGAMGFFRNEPEDDASIWKRQQGGVLDEFRKLLRAPKRGVLLAVAQFKASSELSEEALYSCVMNTYQCEEMADNLQEIEYALGRDVAPMAFEADTYRQILAEGGRSIMDAAGKRTTRVQAMAAIGIACVALLVGFLPYCFGVGGGAIGNASAWLVTVASCLLLAIVAVITLASMRNNVREAYRGFNGTIGSLLLELHQEASRIGGRISSYATFKKSWSLLDRQRHRGDPSERTVRLGKQEALLRTRMSDIEKISDSVTVDYNLYRSIMREGWDGALRLLENPSFFNVCDAQRAKRPLNEGSPFSALVDAPYSFVSGIDLVRIEVS